MLLALWLSAGGAAFGATVHTVSKKGMQGHLVSVDDKGVLVLQAKDKTEARLASADVIRVLLSNGDGHPADEDTEFLLANGDLLYGSVAGTEEEGQSLRIRVRSLGKVVLPLEAFRFIRFPRGRKKTLRVEPGTGKDIVYRRNGDKVSGSVESFSHKGVTVERGGNLAQIPFGELEAIYVAPLYESKPPQGLYTVFRLKDGGRATTRLLSLADGIFRLALLAGVTVEVAEEEVLGFSFRNGNFVYLSDLVPETVKEIQYLFEPIKTWTPPFSVEMKNYRRDRNYTGNPIRLGGRRYFKGIGSHSYCEIHYRLGKAYNRFEAVVGLDDETKGKRYVGSVIFRLLLDGKQVYDSGVVKTGTPPKPVGIDVSGAESLVLVVDYTGDPLDMKDIDTLDRADWADALLTRK